MLWSLGTSKRSICATHELALARVSSRFTHSSPLLVALPQPVHSCAGFLYTHRNREFTGHSPGSLIAFTGGAGSTGLSKMLSVQHCVHTYR